MESNNVAGLGQITKVARHHIETVNIYEISDSELKELEMGNEADTYLNIGLSCISFAGAFLLAILTSTFKDDFSKLLVHCVTVIFGLAGIIMFVLWWQKRKSKKSIIETIRNRGTNKDN